MRSSWDASSRSSSATRWFVAGGEGADSRDGERDREGERFRPPLDRLAGGWGRGPQAPVMCEDRALYGVMDYECTSRSNDGGFVCETTNRKCYDYGEW